MKFTLGFAFVVTLLTCSQALATETSCQNDIRQCFSEEGAKKSNCFYRISESSECKDTETGKLAAKRWALSGTPAAQGANSFLGPAAIDSTCIATCDNQWFAFLIAEEDAASATGHISSCLDSCRIGDNLEIIRP